MDRDLCSVFLLYLLSGTLLAAKAVEKERVRKPTWVLGYTTSPVGGSASWHEKSDVFVISH